MLHRIIYQEEAERNRDLIFEIASKYSEFSISKIFLSQTDVEYLLLNPSALVINLFDTILYETNDSRQIHTLDFCNAYKFVTFTLNKH